MIYMVQLHNGSDSVSLCVKGTRGEHACIATEDFEKKYTVCCCTSERSGDSSLPQQSLKHSG